MATPHEKTILGVRFITAVEGLIGGTIIAVCETDNTHAVRLRLPFGGKAIAILFDGLVPDDEPLPGVEGHRYSLLTDGIQVDEMLEAGVLTKEEHERLKARIDEQREKEEHDMREYNENHTRQVVTGLMKKYPEIIREIVNQHSS